MKFDLQRTGSDAVVVAGGRLTYSNAAALRVVFPWTAPVSLADRKTTFGCGDRLGRT